ncbi:MAG: HAD-IA family hydrolase [Lachnospiraceae bacterium]|nr:HAD-IA family hydrolase [Lachnospiraceae bacterium]
MYNSVFFDLDGTITQSEFGIIESILYALEKLGIHEENPDNLKRFIGPPLFNAFQDFYDLSDEKAEEAVRIYREYYGGGGMFNAPLYEGIADTIKTLHAQGKKLYVVTSKPTPFAKRIVEHFELLSYFEEVVGPDFSDKGYTKEALVKRAMELSGAPDYIMVGDRHYDIEGAKAAGIHSIGVTYGYGSRKELEEAGATYVADHASEIQSICNR